MTTSDEIDPADLKRRYESGATIRRLAAETGLSFRRTRETLLVAGVTLRPQKIQVPPCPPGMVKAYEDGASLRQLATRCGHSFGQTRNMLLQAGVVLRLSGHPRHQPMTAEEREQLVARRRQRTGS